jgi:hypothetical protein
LFGAFVFVPAVESFVAVTTLKAGILWTLMTPTMPAVILTGNECDCIGADEDAALVLVLVAVVATVVEVGDGLFVLEAVNISSTRLQILVGT